VFSEQAELWAGFTLMVSVLLAIDLLLINGGGDQAVSVRKALLWSAFWIGMAMVFATVVFLTEGRDHGVEYLTGYVIEKSLSVDNLFVFLIIFQFLAVPPGLRGRALTYGIMGALILRLGFILAGAALLEAFHWIVFGFGGLLIVTAFRLAFQGEHEMDIEKNAAVRLLRRLIPVTTGYLGTRFLVRVDGQLMATPLVIVLVAIATTDVVFAVDSIPAIFAITDDPFIVYTSNAFAILGMRALFFAVAGLIGYFTYLRQGLVVVLAFVGVKMLISDFYEIPTLAALGVVLAILLVAVIFSLLLRKGAPAIEAADSNSQTSTSTGEV
jgi:TerC family integral membrane protein